MQALWWIVGLAIAGLVVWLFVTAMKREMAKPDDRKDGEWGDVPSSDYGSRD